MEPIRVLAISASPRKNGNSLFLLDTLLEDTSFCRFPVDVRRASLAEEKIGPCIGCLACYKNGGTCVLRDDFEALRQQWKQADCVLYSAPVYVAGIPGQMKCFFDRLNNADFGLAVRGPRYMKPIGAITQGGDFFGGGAELAMLDIMRHAAMIKGIYVPPDDSYFGAGGWVWDSHTHAMADKAKQKMPDFQLTMQNAKSVLRRMVELAAILRGGVLALRGELAQDERYHSFFSQQDRQNEAEPPAHAEE